MMSSVTRGIPIGPPRFKVAVHALIWLATHGCVLSSANIAGLVGTHPTFMRRVMLSLSSAGIVESKGGREGGYFLCRSADQITLGEVYCAVNRESDSECSSACGEAGHRIDSELENILQEVERRSVEWLQGYTIMDLLRKAGLDNLEEHSH